MTSLMFYLFQSILAISFVGVDFYPVVNTDSFIVRGFTIENDYVVLLSSPDRSTDLHSVLVIQEAIVEDIPKQKMHVDNRGDKILLRSDDNCYILQVDHTEIEAAYSCDDPIYIKGIGLSTHRIHKKIRVDDFISSIENDIFSALSDGPGIKIDKCNICASGGPGASQCDYSGDVATIGVSCSVTCREGYYACCHVSCYCCLEPNSFDIAPDDK